MACLTRFGTLRPVGNTPILRSDNGLVFQRRRFREACRFYQLPQEYSMPYTPEQHGVLERWFRSLKGECVWHHQVSSFAEAKAAICAWIRWYNADCPQ